MTNLPAVDVLREYLVSQRSAGVSHVLLTGDGLQRLAGLRGGGRGAEAGVRVPGQAAGGSEVQAEARGGAALAVEKPVAVPRPAPRQEVGREAAPAVERKPAPVAEAPVKRPVLKLEGLVGEEGLRRFRAQVEVLGGSVAGQGRLGAEVMVVALRPDGGERGRGKLFDGVVSDKLTAILKAMGLARSDVYVTYVCKKPAGEAVDGAEMEDWLKLWKAEVGLIRPRCVVGFGADMGWVLGLDQQLEVLRAQVHELGRVPVVITHDLHEVIEEEQASGRQMQIKRRVWENMLMVMAEVGLEISEKQRGYFRQ